MIYKLREIEDIRCNRLLLAIRGIITNIVHSSEYRLSAVIMEDSLLEEDEKESELLSGTTEVAVKGPIVEVLTKEQQERMAEIEVFLHEHDVKVNRKKKKLLASLSVGPFETYKLGVVIANCCKVRVV